MQRPQRDSTPPLDTRAPTPDVATVRVRAGSPDSRIATALSVVAVLVLVAVLKPWGVASPLATAGPFVAAPTEVVITPTPTEDTTADGLASPVCLGSGGWQIATLERWRTQDVRVWRAIEPIAVATGPLDLVIPAVPVVADEVAALGWCAPAYGPARPAGPATVTAWSVRNGVAGELQLRQLLPAHGSTPIAALYVPVTVCPETTNCLPLLPAAAPRAWASERVVFRYHDGGGSGELWLAADVTVLPPSATPEASGRTGP
jgi:hypothetical protein